MTDFEVAGYHHVQLAMPRDEEAAAEAFYADVLGLARVPKPPELAARGGCWFHGEGVEVHLGVEDPFAPARKAHPAFLVRGLDALRDRLQEAGVDVGGDQPPLEGMRRIHALDPFGNRLEFLEADPAR